MPAPGGPATGDLADHVAFDHDVVDLVVVDAREGDDERDVTTKRFPNWGDAADLVDVLDVRPDGDLRYRCSARADWRRPVVEGSQMLGQAVVAASRHVPGRRVVSASMVFLRAADARVPYAIELDPISSGTDLHLARGAGDARATGPARPGPSCWT